MTRLPSRELLRLADHEIGIAGIEPTLPAIYEEIEVLQHKGTYQGGVPGSNTPAGTHVRFHGNDIWRPEAGMIREYWLSDDLLDLMQQLGVIAGT